MLNVDSDDDEVDLPCAESKNVKQRDADGPRND